MAHLSQTLAPAAEHLAEMGHEAMALRLEEMAASISSDAWTGMVLAAMQKGSGREQSDRERPATKEELAEIRRLRREVAQLREEKKPPSTSPRRGCETVFFQGASRASCGSAPVLGVWLISEQSLRR
ncbi:MAG: hypothetical protein H6714_03025 [Myxococcales bacterium]|nr:hypothetical protein [Myxococcales bacterium]